MRILLVVLTTLSLAFATGCGSRKKAEEQASLSQQELTHKAVESLRTELDALREEGKTDVVISRIEAVMGEPAFTEAQPLLFSMLISELVSQGRTDEARAEFLAIAGSDSSKARTALGTISSYYDREGMHAEMIDWFNTLIDLPLVEELRLQVWAGAIRLYVGLGRTAEIPERVPTLFATLANEQDRLMLLSRAATTMLREKLYGDNRRLLDAVEKQQPYGEAIQQWVIASRADLFLAEGRLDDADAFLWEHVTALTDPEASRRFRELMQSRIKAGDSDASAGLARRAMGKLADLPATRDTIVTLWIEAATNAKDHNAFLDRTQEALDAKVSIRRLLGSFEKGVYDVLSNGSDALRQRCTEIMQEMGGVEAAADENCAARLTLLSLDAAFYKNDFKEALAIINRGIPERDGDWHDVLINKVSAHLALQEGRIEDAIGHFRAHMKTVEAWEQAERDPATGIMMIKEAVLGFNEKRIGDIYAGAGKQAEARQAYAAARKWYEKALKEVAAESEEHETYMQEMALVPTT